MNTTETLLSGYKGWNLTSPSSITPDFGPFNSLMCRPGKMASFPLDTTIPQTGLVVAMDFYPYPAGPDVQTIFSLRDTSNNFISVRVDYLQIYGSVNVGITPTIATPNYLFNSTMMGTIPVQAGNNYFLNIEVDLSLFTSKGSWNRIIFELTQGQPYGLGVGYSAVRVWVNENGTPRVFFGNFSNGGNPAVADGNDAVLDLCGVFDSTSPNNINSTLSGSFDVMNFVWFVGAQNLFPNVSTSNYTLQGYPLLNSSYLSVRCAPGSYLQDNVYCVASPSNNSYFLHSPTNSYQRCFYEPYYNITGGFCTPCNEDGQLIAGPECVNCDPTCKRCNGTTSSQCTECYSSSYYSNGTCLQCSTECQTCNGPTGADCNSCLSGYFSFINSTGSYCRSICPQGDFANNQSQKCEVCDVGCQTCYGPTNADCSICLSGYFSYFNSTGSYCLSVCPLRYKPDYASYKCVITPVNISVPVSVTLQAASPVISASFIIANGISDRFSLRVIISLVAIESLANMQYLNINHSTIASTIYSEMSSCSIPNWIAKFNNLDKSLLIVPWGIFQMNQASSLYLDNYGDSLTEIMVYLGLFIMTAVLVLSQETEKLAKSFLGKVYVTMFSLFASSILGKMQSQLLFSILQLLKFYFLFDTYSVMSLIVGYLTMSFSIGLNLFCFFRVLTVFKRKSSHWRPKISDESGIKTYIQIKWFEKKYEFLFGDFRMKSKNQFFFAFWISGFSPIYILLIISLQSIPVLQCLSIVIPVISFIIFPAANKPFKKKLSAFLYFFNFSCILIAAILNLILAIIQNLLSEFSGVEIQGWIVVSVIFINTGINTLVALGSLIWEIYKKLKKYDKDDNKKNPGLSNSVGKNTAPVVEMKTVLSSRKSRPLQMEGSSSLAVKNFETTISPESLNQAPKKMIIINLEDE